MKPARLIKLTETLYEIEGMEIDFNGPTREYLRIIRYKQGGDRIIVFLVFEPTLLEWAFQKSHEMVEQLQKFGEPITVRIVEAFHGKGKK